MLTESLNILLADENRRQTICDFMQNLYRQIDRKIERYDTSCERCNRCCDFEASGLNLFVTSLELAFFMMRGKTLPPPAAGRCPYLDEKTGCQAREHRPVGCRTFFCHHPDQYDYQTIYEDAIGEIKRFLNDNRYPYFYQEWLGALKGVDAWTIESAE